MDLAAFSEATCSPAGKYFGGGEGGNSPEVQGTVPAPARSRSLPHFIFLYSCETSDAGGGFHHTDGQMGQKTGATTDS